MRQHLPDRKVGKASLTADTGRLARGYEAPEPGTVGSGDEVTRNRGAGSMGTLRAPQRHHFPRLDPGMAAERFSGLGGAGKPDHNGEGINRDSVSSSRSK